MYTYGAKRVGSEISGDGTHSGGTTRKHITHQYQRGQNSPRIPQPCHLDRPLLGLLLLSCLSMLDAVQNGRTSLRSTTNKWIPPNTPIARRCTDDEAAAERKLERYEGSEAPM